MQPEELATDYVWMLGIFITLVVTLVIIFLLTQIKIRRLVEEKKVFKQLEKNLHAKADEIDDKSLKKQLKEAAGFELKNITSMKLDKSIHYTYTSMVR